MINKSVIMNCRWIVKPVRPDGEAVPSLLGTEVRNMDYVYFEQVPEYSDNPERALIILPSKEKELFNCHVHLSAEHPSNPPVDLKTN